MTDEEKADRSSFRGGLVVQVGCDDGKKIAAIDLDAPPVFDGLIASRGYLYLSTVGGRVVCLGER